MVWAYRDRLASACQDPQAADQDRRILACPGRPAWVYRDRRVSACRDLPVYPDRPASACQDRRPEAWLPGLRLARRPQRPRRLRPAARRFCSGTPARATLRSVTISSLVRDAFSSDMFAPLARLPLAAWMLSMRPAASRTRRTSGNLSRLRDGIQYDLVRSSALDESWSIVRGRTPSAASLVPRLRSILDF